MITLSKLEAAEHQLERALQLFLEEADYVSAITLAGASEELLGKLLEQQGKEPVIKNFAAACVAAGHHVKENWREKIFISMANSFRDGLKHITDGQPISVSSEAAADILDRAVENYFSLTGKETHRMRAFREAVYGE